MRTNREARSSQADHSRQQAPPARAGSPGAELWAVVLAGGEGRRLERFVRHVLRHEAPKQFCRIIGTRSMLRHTWDRALRLVEPDRIVTVITAGQQRYLAAEGRGGVPGTVFVQPENRETAPGLLLPLLWIQKRSPAATVVVFPADHFIWEEGRFIAHMRAAVAAAHSTRDRLILLGVEADRPETGYGWIAPGDPVEAAGEAEVYAVRRFWEKPDGPTAARLFARGYLWNTFILAGRPGAFLEPAEAAIPEVMAALRRMGSHPGTPGETRTLREVYREMPPANFSRAVLAGCPQRLLVLAARGIAWSDWGDPDRIVRTVARFGRRPAWLPEYAASLREAAAAG